MCKMKIGIANDHAGFPIKRDVVEFLQSQGYEVVNFGSDSADPVDYPDYGHPLASAVENGDVSLGIAICGTGNGINIVTNKHQGVRSALCWNEKIAALVRQHNDANICALPGRFITAKEAVEIVRTFVTSEFEGGRHIPRINKIPVTAKEQKE